jgi:hypothetical protein
MASFMYNAGKAALLRGDIDLENDTIKVALVTLDYSPDKDTHDHFDDVTNEVSGTGYTAGGAALASKAVNQDDANDRAEFSAADVTWSSSTITARAAVIYMDTGTLSTSILIAYVDFGHDYSSSGTDFTIEWNAEGIFYVGE